MQRDEQEKSHEELWKSQEEESMEVTAEQVWARARRYEKENVLAHWLMIFFTTLFAGAFVYNLMQFRDPWLITANMLALGSLCYVSWIFVRHGPTRIRAAEPGVSFLLREFRVKRQRLLGIRWGVLLFFPVMLASWKGGGPVIGAKTLGIPSPWSLRLHAGPAPLIVMALLLAFVWFAFTKELRKAERDLRNLGTD